MHTEHSEEFAERFIRERTDTIDVDGTRVHLRLRLPGVAPGTSLRIHFESHHSGVRQAIGISTTKGTFTVNGVRANPMILWADTSPQVVECALSHRVPTEIVVWNAWERPGGGVDSGLRYAGILIDEQGQGQWRLRCSDGLGGPDFDDLVVRVELRP